MGDRTSATAPLLDVEDLAVEFDLPHGRFLAVEPISFQVDAGKTIGVVGESGSGKTVLARAIMGLLPSTATALGSARLEGEELIGLPERRRRDIYGRRVAMIFQDPATSLNPVRTIGSQLAESFRFHMGVSRRAARAMALDLLTRVEVQSAEERLDQYPHEMSGGMRQRVVIAMALSCGPQLLIADEPTTALDVTVQRTILDLLDRLREEERMAVVLITHDLEVARGRCDDVMVMYAGHAVEAGGAAELLDAPRHPYTAALLDAMPAFGSPRDEPLRPIPGRVPDLDERPPGCAFAPRCGSATDVCRVVDPEQSEVAGHRFWCHHPLSVSELATGRR